MRDGKERRDKVGGGWRGVEGGEGPMFTPPLCYP